MTASTATPIRDRIDTPDTRCESGCGRPRDPRVFVTKHGTFGLCVVCGNAAAKVGKGLWDPSGQDG